jgi:hypothetical protein
MPCYGESCCDFCGNQIGARKRWHNESDDEKDQDDPKFDWLSTSELIDSSGVIHDYLSPNLMYEMEDDDDDNKRYTNKKLDSIDNVHLYEGVFLHTFCRQYLEDQTGWSPKRIFKILRTIRQPFNYKDHQRGVWDAIESGELESWRAKRPDINDKNGHFFQKRLKCVMNHC